MITDAFISLPYAFLSMLIGFFPASQGFPVEVIQSAELIGSKIGIFEPVMPIATLSLVLGVLFSAQLGMWSWKTFKWVISHIPYFGGRG